MKLISIRFDERTTPKMALNGDLGCQRTVFDTRGPKDFFHLQISYTSFAGFQMNGSSFDMQRITIAKKSVKLN